MPPQNGNRKTDKVLIDMSISQEPSAEFSGPNGGGKFSLRRLAVWLPGVIVLGALVAWGGVNAQFYFAPLIIFPLLVGVVLGGLLIGLIRTGQIGHRPTIIIGTILGVLVAAVGEHYCCYISACNTELKQSPLIEKARQAFPEDVAQRVQTPPAGFLEYMRRQAQRGRPLLLDYSARGWIAWLSWIIDGFLILAGTLAVVIPAMFLPFCGRCQTWYRAIRSVHITAGASKQIGRIAGVEAVEHLKSGRCRLICCHSGCGPTGCELYWEDTAGDTYFARVWLDADRRNQVMQALDQAVQAEEDGITGNNSHG